MSLRDFLDAAYTLLLRELQRKGVDLFDALEKLAPFAARTAPIDGAVLSEKAKMRAEEQAMKDLNAQLQRAGMPTLG